MIHRKTKIKNISCNINKYDNLKFICQVTFNIYLNCYENLLKKLLFTQIRWFNIMIYNVILLKIFLFWRLALNFKTLNRNKIVILLAL